jgi:hypothetical protein
MADGSRVLRLAPQPAPASSDVEWASIVVELRLALVVDRRSTLSAVRVALRDLSLELRAAEHRLVTLRQAIARGAALKPAVVEAFQNRCAGIRARQCDLAALLPRIGAAPAAPPAEASPAPAAAPAPASAAYVRSKVAECIWTLRRLPMPQYATPPRDLRSGMREPVRDFWEAYNAVDAPKVTRERPTAEQISAASETVPWLYFIDVKPERDALCLRAIPLSWRKVGDALGCSHVQAIKLEARAVDCIVRRLRNPW